MITIITPVFNGIRFIEACILNVMEQKCADVEHIIVDGGSTDGTVKIINLYADRYKHIRWISEKDRGQSDAMNKGILMARGDILGFLNVDDFYEKDVLKRVVGLFKTLPEPTLLVGNCHRWNDAGEIYEENKPAKLGIVDLMLGWKINPFPVNPSQYFYHKSLHEKIGLYKVEEHFTLDIDFLIRAVQKTNVTYRNEFWGNYRFIEGTKTFQDTQENLCAQRFESVLNEYRQQLPPHLRLLIAVKRSWYHTCGDNHLVRQLRHLMNNPREFFRLLRDKIKRTGKIRNEKGQIAR